MKLKTDNNQFTPKKFLSPSILFGSNVILRLKPKKTLCIILYENLDTFRVHSK